MCTKRDSFRAIIVTPGCIADPEVDMDNDTAFRQGTCYLGTHLEHIPPSPPRGRSVETYKRPDVWLLCQCNLMVFVGCGIWISDNTHVMFAWSHLCCWVGLQRLAKQYISLRWWRILQHFISCVLIVSLLSMNLSTITCTLWNVPNGYVFLWQNQISGRCVLNLFVILRTSNEFTANVDWRDSCLCKYVGASDDCKCLYGSAAGRDVCVWGEDWWPVLQVWWCIYVL